MQKNKPNLDQVDLICGKNMVYRKRLLNVIKRELFLEAANYKENFKSGNFMECSENVHKLRHKISILGLEDAYYFALTYEEDLRIFNISKSEVFEIILNDMISFTKQF